MLFHWFFGRDNPLEAATLSHLRLNKSGFPGKNRQSGAQEVGSVLGIGFVGLAVLNLIDDLRELHVGRAQAGNAGFVLLDESGERNFLQIGGEAEFHEGSGLVFFRGVELREARAEDVSLPEVGCGADGFLLEAVIDEPDFGAVILRGIADENDFEKGLIGLEINFVMELGDEGAQFFEENDTYFFQVGVT